jgi:hypothetical protein
MGHLPVSDQGRRQVAEGRYGARINREEVSVRARLLIAAAALTVGLAGCGSGADDGAQAAPVAPTSAAAVGAKVTAQQLVDRIAEKWPLPNPDDNSSGCKAKEGDTAAGCTARITTDAVTVTEYPDTTTAKKAATTLGKTGGDYRAVGWFVLSWGARDQDLTSDEARDDMVKIAQAAIK